MTPDQLTVLAARMLEGCRDPVTGERLRPGEFAGVSIEDVEAAAEYLRQCAQADEIEALRWEKPGPVSPNHPIECLVVLSALRQSDGDWWIEGNKFLADDLPIAWVPDTPEARAVLAAQGGKDV